MRKGKAEFSSSVGGYRAVLLHVPMEWQLQQPVTLLKSKIVKGYLAFIQGLLVAQSALTHYSPHSSPGTHSGAHPAHPGYSPSSPRCFFLAP
jgi:hypothetical protein